MAAADDVGKSDVDLDQEREKQQQQKWEETKAKMTAAIMKWDPMQYKDGQSAEDYKANCEMSAIVNLNHRHKEWSLRVGIQNKKDMHIRLLKIDRCRQLPQGYVDEMWEIIAPLREHDFQNVEMNDPTEYEPPEDELIHFDPPIRIPLQK